jgi:hypothetical protein
LFLGWHAFGAIELSLQTTGVGKVCGTIYAQGQDSGLPSLTGALVNALPIVPQFSPDPPHAWLTVMDSTFRRLRRQRRELFSDDGLTRLQVRRLDDRPLVHLDDQSDTALLDNGRKIHYRQDVARMRAGEADFVAASLPPVEGYESYCRDRLGLGAAKWMCPRTTGDPAQLAVALWQDEFTRRALITAMRRGLLGIDPYQGNASIWQLAALLDEEHPGAVHVVAPLPQVTAWVNHKVEFTRIVCELFGESLIPRTSAAANLAMAAEAIRDLAPGTSRIVLKLPDSAGGGGNVLLRSDRFRHCSLREIHAALQEEFRNLAWNGKSELQISEWESDVLKAPSVQLWIPPGDFPPIVEGLFEQHFGDERGMFLGMRAAELEPELAREIVDRAWVLARLFQRLGYVGRCSFDLLLVGESGGGRVKFLECNGRWGGASTPMSLMNRLFGDWTQQPFVVRNYDDLGLEPISFPRLVRELEDELFDVRTGHGHLILINPARMEARGGIGALVLGPSWDAAEEAAGDEVPKRLRAIAMSNEDIRMPKEGRMSK